MAATKETIKTKVLVTPEWDKRAVKKLEQDFGKVQKKISSVKMDWTRLSRSSKTAVQDIKNISDAAAEFSKELSGAARASIKDISKLGKELTEATKRAEELRKRAAKASTPEEAEAISGEMAEAEKQMIDLNRQIQQHRKVDRQYVTELKGVVKAQRDARKKYQEDLRKAAAYTGKDFRKDFASSLKRSATGGLRGAAEGVGGAVRAGGRYSAGVSARAAMGGGGSIVPMLSKMVPVLAGLTTGLAAFIGFIAKASGSITKMNKALLEGTGYANDFTTKSGAYTTAIDDLRKATKDASGHLLTLGGNTEQTAQIVNRYMTEASGSVVKTRDAMTALGKGDTAKGVEILSRNAIAYGKALGIEVTDVAAMVGKMENEIGYGAMQSQDAMADIVKAAATSNMPVSKFMDIFRQTIPQLELFTNRMEELTGVIKLLSKNMSAADVKKFMDAFSKGFQGMSFEERVQHVLVAGVPKTNKMLQKGFEQRAETIAQALGPDLQESFMAAFKKGDKEGMNKILAVAKSRGAQAATIGEAQKLMGADADRRAGGPLGTGSAVKGASMRENMKIFEAELETFGHKAGTRISGLMEHVAEKRGYGQDQIQAYNQYISSMDEYTTSLKTYGTTVSRSMDAALKKIIAEENFKGKKTADEITPEDMAKASRDQIERASELSNKGGAKAQQTSIDLAREQADATVSLGEKLDNVIGYILEQIYEKVSSVVKILNDIFNSVIDWVLGDKKKTERKAGIDRYEIKGYSPAEQKGFSDLKDTLKGGVEKGQTGMDLAHTAGGYYSDQFGKMQEEMFAARKRYSTASTPEEKRKAAADVKASEDQVLGFKEAFKSTIMGMTTKGMHPAQAMNISKGIDDALSKGDFGKALEAVAAFGKEGDVNGLLKFGQTILPKALTEADRKAASSGKMRRGGTGELEIQKFQKDKEVAEEVSDTVQDLKEISKGGTLTSGVVAGAAPGAAPGTAKSAAVHGVRSAEQQHKEVVQTQEDSSEKQVKATDDVYDGIQDVASILKKGIRYESGFLGGAYTNAIKAATLDSFRDALIEYAVIQAKMQRSPGFSGFLADYSQDFVGMGSGAAMGLLTGEVGKGSGGDPNAVEKQFQSEKDKLQGSMLSGGPIPDTGNYRLHRGEYVVPSMPAGSGGRQGGGGSPVSATVIINGSGLSQQQLEGAVYGAMHKIANRP